MKPIQYMFSLIVIDLSLVLLYAAALLSTTASYSSCLLDISKEYSINTFLHYYQEHMSRSHAPAITDHNMLWECTVHLT